MKLRLSWAWRGTICLVLPRVPQVRAVHLGSSYGINAATSSLAPGPAAPGSSWEGLSSWDLDARLWLGVVELWRMGITALLSCDPSVGAQVQTKAARASCGDKGRSSLTSWPRGSCPGPSSRWGFGTGVVPELRLIIQSVSKRVSFVILNAEPARTPKFKEV